MSGCDPDEPRVSPEEASSQLEREHEQLFHELRAVIPGAEVLFAFLLTIAFSSRFGDLSTGQLRVYYATFLCSGVALMLLLAPTAFHRLRFRHHDKEAMIRLANVEVLGAMALISLAIAGVVYLVTDLVIGEVAAASTATGLWIVNATVWWAIPLARRFGADQGTPAAASPGGDVEQLARAGQLQEATHLRTDADQGHPFAANLGATRRGQQDP